MKRMVLFTLAVLCSSWPAFAQIQGEPRYTLLYNYDLDGEAADDDQVVTAANGALTDSANLVLTADPDVCRLLVASITDADSSVTGGVLTVAGKDCLGYTKSCSWTFAGDGTIVTNLTCADGKGAYFSDVTGVTTNVLTGEGAGDTVKIGYTANSVNGFATYGRLNAEGPSGEHGVDPFGSYPVGKKITTSGSSSTTVTGVSGPDDPFDPVSVGDLLLFSINGVQYERKVTAKASADSITVHAAVNIPTAGVTFAYRKQFYSTDPTDQVWIPTKGLKALDLRWRVNANANTGGVIPKLECGTWGPSVMWTQLTPNVASVPSGSTTVGADGTLSALAESIDLSLLPSCDVVRLGLRFGTGDDADAAAESIDLYATAIR